LGIATALVSLAIALAIHPLVFILCLAVWLLGFLYNWKLKAAGLWGNLIVSTSVAMTFVIGGVSVGQAANPLLLTFGLISFCFDLAEEIAGDAMDAEGDQKRGSKSIAIVHGRSAALRLSGLLFCGVVALTGLPVVWGETGLGYLIPIGLVDALILFFTFRLLRSQTPQAGRRSMRGLYISASLGLVAFILVTFLR
jgi:geranylgeranylglycerol-phosphate geranylgeranyltransferase